MVKKKEQERMRANVALRLHLWRGREHFKFRANRPACGAFV